MQIILNFTHHEHFLDIRKHINIDDINNTIADIITDLNNFCGGDYNILIR